MSIKGIDVSSYQTPLDYSGDFGERVTFVVSKGLQGTSHFSNSRDAGKISGLYYWDDPTANWKYMVGWMESEIKKEHPDLIALDIEQWWADWGLYFAAIRGEVPWSSVPVLPSRTISEHARLTIEELDKIFPKLKKYPYSAAWFIDGRSPDLKEWIYKRPIWWAEYLSKSGPVEWDYFDRVPAGEPKTPNLDWHIWQFSSTMMTPGQTQKLDWNVLNPTRFPTISSFRNYLGIEEKEKPVTAIYKPSVLQKDRANLFWLKGNAKFADEPTKINAVILDGVSVKNIDGHMTIVREGTFKGRSDEWLNTWQRPVIMNVQLNAGYWLKEQHTMTEVVNMSCHTGLSEDGKRQSVASNPFVKMIIDQLCEDSTWNWGDFWGGRVKFKKIHGIQLQMTDTDGFKEEANSLWQSVTFKNVADPLRWLMLRNYLPSYKLLLYTGPWWLAKYPDFTNITLSNYKDILYLHLGEWIFNSTRLFDNLESVFANRPSDDFKFSLIPDGYFERILFHQYSGESQRVRTITNENGFPQTVDLSLFQDNQIGLLSFFGQDITPPPVDDELQALRNRVNQLELKLREIENWYNAFPK